MKILKENAKYNLVDDNNAILVTFTIKEAHFADNTYFLSLEELNNFNEEIYLYIEKFLINNYQVSLLFFDFPSNLYLDKIPETFLSEFAYNLLKKEELEFLWKENLLDNAYYRCRKILK